MAIKTSNGNVCNPIATTATAITPADGTVFPEPFIGLYVGGAGNIKVDMMDGTSTAILFSAVAAGSTLPIGVTKVYSTGTTATLIIGLK